MPPPNYLAMRQFIQAKGLEGQSKNVGYIPMDRQKNVIGNSGVTIGVGFDLGQHNKQQLVDMGFSNKMIKTLSPYLGKKGNEAKSFLENNELVLSSQPGSNQDYLETITKPTKYYSDILASKYDKATGVPGDFSRLEAPMQGAIYSVFYQLGMSNPSKSAPKFWKHATGKNWKGLLNELETGAWGNKKIGEEPGQQRNRLRWLYDRRKLEAKKLRESGSIVAQSVFDQEGPDFGYFT